MPADVFLRFRELLLLIEAWNDVLWTAIVSKTFDEQVEFKFFSELIWQRRLLNTSEKN